MTDGLPAVAVLVEPSTLDVFAMAASARGLCRLVWAGDLADPELARQRRALARFGTVVDVHDRPGADVAAELRGLGVAGVVAFTDPPLRYAAALARELGLPFHSAEVAAALTDKALQRDRLAAAGVPSAAHVVVPLGSPVPQGFPVPAVVKPRRGTGSRRVVFAPDEAAVRAAVAAAGEDVLVEEHLPDLPAAERAAHRADLLSVEVLAAGGEAAVVGLTQRWPLEPPFRETGSFVPAGLPGEVEADVAAVALAAVGALGVREGFAHVEVKRTPTGPRVVEVNGRLGGLIADYHRRGGGADLFRQAYLVALGRSPDDPVALERVAYLLWVYAPDDLVEVGDVTGLDEVRAMPGVEDVRLHLPPGSPVDAALGNDSHVVTVAGVAPDQATAMALRLGILRAIAIS